MQRESTTGIFGQSHPLPAQPLCVRMEYAEVPSFFRFPSAQDYAGARQEGHRVVHAAHGCFPALRGTAPTGVQFPPEANRKIVSPMAQ
ncbi:protein of unknown function [Burkholderia multivorans]